MLHRTLVARAALWACLAWTGPGMAVSFSPADLRENTIPVSDADAQLTLADGMWTPVVRLPDHHPRDGIQYHIATSAAYPTTLLTRNTDLGIDSLTLHAGNQISFRYRKDGNVWTVVAPVQSPRGGSDMVASAANALVSLYELRDGDWTGKVRLPADATDGALVLIRSAATWPSAIDPAHALFPSSLRLQHGDAYLFQFSKARGRWMPLRTARRIVQARTVAGRLPHPTAPVTKVRFADGNWTPSIALPASASDRDRIVFTSQATWPATLLPDAANPRHAVRIATGQRYDFTYVKAESAWKMTSHPRRLLLVKHLPQGVIPQPTTPITDVLAGDANWARELVLPQTANPGDAIVVRSTAAWPFAVRSATSATPRHIKTGDTVRFTFSEGKWDTGTHVVDILLVYSDAAAQRLGDQGMRMRLYEGLRLTNEALENAKANLYYNPVAVVRRTVRNGGTTLDQALSAIRFDPDIQAELRDRKADAIYYEGTEAGCGLAYVRPNSFSMVGTGSLACGTTVMRHELGHNLGLSHGGERYANPRYAAGNTLHGTVMGGNAIPYYSTPHILHPITGEPLGIPDQIDAVRVINERSQEIAAFR